MSRPVLAGFDRSDVGRAIVALLASTVGLALSGWILPGISFDGWWPIVLVALVMAVVGLVVRPVLVALATPFGMVGALVLALLGQALVAYIALSVVPGVTADSFLSAFWATWIIAAVATLASWVMTDGTNDAVFAHLVRGARRGKPVEDPEVTGILFVQLDGVPFPVLQWGVMGGTLPTLSRWMRGGSHGFMEWTPTLPATTPASQMGILHGTTDGIPAFRWVDRATGRVFVANKPADAVDIEALHSDGHGLLADGGVSVSNLFSGDAPTTFATMSRVGALRGDRDGRRRFNRFLMRPDGFMRGVVRTTSELVRERTQARRQIRQNMRPRVHRGWDFAGERGASTASCATSTASWSGRPWPPERAASTSTTWTTTRSPTTPASCDPSPWTRWRGSTPSSASSRGSPPRPSGTTGSWCCQTTGSRRARCSPTATARACPTSSPGLRAAPWPAPRSTPRGR